MPPHARIGCSATMNPPPQNNHLTRTVLVRWLFVTVGYHEVLVLSANLLYYFNEKPRLVRPSEKESGGVYSH